MLRRGLLNTVGKFILKVLLILIPIVIAYYTYKYTDVFTITNVEVNYMNSYEFTNEITEKVNEIESFKKSKYFDIDTFQLTNDVKNTSPFINTVNIEKQLPNKIILYLTIKQPLLSLEIDKTKCVMLDDVSYVLKIENNECKEQVSKYKTIIVKTDDPKLDFQEGKKSSYNQLEYIKNVLKVLNSYNIPVYTIDINNNVAIFMGAKNIVYIFSFNQDVNTQLARLVSLFTEFEKKTYKYSTVDLRFNRPVISK